MSETTNFSWLFSLQDDRGIFREISRGVNARIFPGERSMVSVVRIDRYSSHEVHSHPEEQWGVLLEGECVRIQDGQEVRVRAGNFWHTPPNVPHGIRTEEHAALLLDLFSPARSDYL